MDESNSKIDKMMTELASKVELKLVKDEMLEKMTNLVSSLNLELDEMDRTVKVVREEPSAANSDRIAVKIKQNKTSENLD